MKWNHLPEPGGLYQQDPDFVDGVALILSARGDYEKREQDKRDREARKAKPKGR